MKKWVAGLLSGISIVNCMPNAGAMHFQPGQNTVNSKSNKIDVKSAVFGAGLSGLFGLLGIPVAGLIGNRIGKGNVNTNVKCTDVNLNLSEFKDCSRLEQFQNKKNYRDLFFKALKDHELQGYGDEQDLNFEDIFQIKDISINDCGYKSTVIVPKNSVDYDCIVIALNNVSNTITDCQFYILKKQEGTWIITSHCLVNGVQNYQSNLIDLFQFSRFVGDKIEISQKARTSPVPLFEQWHLTLCKGFRKA